MFAYFVASCWATSEHPGQIAARIVSEEQEVSANRPAGHRQPPQMRQAFLVDTARKRGVLVVSDVAAELGVSEMTIRRDLVELERDGALVRTHGGAIAPEGAVPTPIDREEPAFDGRLRVNDEAK